MKELKEKFLKTIKAMDFSDKTAEELMQLSRLSHSVRDMDCDYGEEVGKLAQTLKAVYSSHTCCCSPDNGKEVK